MHVHTTDAHDTIFKIARLYSVQPTKILEDNGLSSDRLAAGEELLILNPTRTVTVRGGESLSALGKRFGVKRSSLIANNPSLRGSDELRPGHILSVKFDTPPLGVASAVGIYTKGTSRSKLNLSLPYLTYIIVEAYSLRKGEIKEKFISEGLGDEFRRGGKIPLLGFTDKRGGEAISAAERGQLCQSIVTLAKEGGYSGISLDVSSSASARADLIEFTLDLKKHLYGNDLILFCHGNSLSNENFLDIADGVIFHPAKENLLTEEECERTEFSKSFAFVDTSAFFGEKRGRISEAKRIARARNIEIKKSGLPPYCHFEYKKYLRGKGVPCHVSYPSLECIHSLYKAGAEMGFLGFTFDISQITVPALSMFNVCFARADYTLL
jgi:LysM repeat protein